MKHNSGYQLTDAAAELARVMEMLFLDPTEPNIPAYSVINQYVVPKETDAVIKIYAALLKRSGNILKFVNEVEDEFIDEDLRKATAEAVATMRGAFLPTQFATPWPQLKLKYIQKQHIQALKYFSRTMRAHRPFIKIAVDDIDTVRVSLGEAAAEISSRDDIPLWARNTLYEALEEIIFQFNNYLMCGYDEIIDQILNLSSKTIAISMRWRSSESHLIN